MNRRRLSAILLSSGVVLGVATTLGWMLGFDPTPLSPAIVTIALYKLTYIAAGGMLAAGAIVGRWARQEDAVKSVDHRVAHPDDAQAHIGNDGGARAVEHAGLERRAESPLPEPRSRQESR